MSNLTEIENRHRPDRFRDAVFILAALVLTAVSIGSVTSKAAGKSSPRQWALTVTESPIEIVR